MPKMKTSKSVAKRFRKTGTGKIMRRKAYVSHILEKKSQKRKRVFAKAAEISKCDKVRIKRLLPGF